jgi:ABC-type dipeptide/oligopeptide/nickel transport system ATPase component
MPSPGLSTGDARFRSSAGAAPAGTPESAALLQVEGLSVSFSGPAAAGLPVVSDVSFEVAAGETLGLVGESGSGKTVSALALVGLLPPAMVVTGGRAMYEGRDLLRLRHEELRAVRGAGIGFVFQEPASALSPVFPVGDQVAEALVVHGRARWAEARTRAIDLLASVRVPDAAACARAYPYQLSGGLRQRVMIAVALACDPPLLVADEPTTALDPTVQAEVLDLLDEMRDRRRLGVLLVTHDLGVIASRAHRVAIMYAGRIVEHASVDEIFGDPRHPYTRALLACAAGVRQDVDSTRDAGQGLRARQVSGGLAEAGAVRPVELGARARPERLPTIEGTVPPLTAMPAGCAFEPRCASRIGECARSVPPLRAVRPGHEAACLVHAPREGNARAAR